MLSSYSSSLFCSADSYLFSQLHFSFANGVSFLCPVCSTMFWFQCTAHNAAMVRSDRDDFHSVLRFSRPSGRKPCPVEHARFQQHAELQDGFPGADPPAHAAAFLRQLLRCLWRCQRGRRGAFGAGSCRRRPISDQAPCARLGRARRRRMPRPRFPRFDCLRLSPAVRGTITPSRHPDTPHVSAGMSFAERMRVRCLEDSFSTSVFIGRVACCSISAQMAGASKSRFDRQPTSAVQQVLRESLDAGNPSPYPRPSRKRGKGLSTGIPC